MPKQKSSSVISDSQPRWPSWSRIDAGIILLLLVGTVGLYWPVRHFEFINFDDPDYVTNNPRVFHGLTAAGLRWAFQTFHASNWHPLTWLSHMLDCQLFGAHAGPQHLVNVGIHTANSILLFLFLRQMAGATFRCAFVALLFAWHPLHLESVAWVSERKDVLSTFFGLLAMIAYARYARAMWPPAAFRDASARPRWLWYFLALVLFVASLMSKPMLVTLPFILLLLDYWPLHRMALKKGRRASNVWRPLVCEKLPFIFFSIASCIITFLAQQKGGAMVNLETVPLGHRLSNAAFSCVAYLGKLFWPAHLSVFYPFNLGSPALREILSGAALSVATFCAVRGCRKFPYLLTGWLWFLGILVPVLGLVQVGSQAMADRYTYLSSVGIFIAVTWGVAELASRWPAGRLVVNVSAGLILIALAVVARIQLSHWRNSVTLFTHAIEVTRENALAQHNLGNALSLEGHQAEAIQHFDEALRIWPAFPAAQLNRANALNLEGELDQAIEGYRNTIAIAPTYAQAHYQLANALVLKGHFEEAKANYLLAIQEQPDYADAHTRLGNLLLLRGLPDEAVRHLREAVKLRPDSEESQYYLGGALARFHQNAAAAACFRAAIKAKPDFASALNDLAWLLATETDSRLRSVPEAVRLSRHACQLTNFKDPAYLDTLTVALAESGQFSEAIKLAQQAEILAQSAGSSKLAAEISKHLEMFQQNHSLTSSARVPANQR